MRRSILLGWSVRLGLSSGLAGALALVPWSSPALAGARPLAAAAAAAAAPPSEADTPYAERKQAIEARRRALARLFAEVSKDPAGPHVEAALAAAAHALDHAIADEILPSWLGVPWKDGKGSEARAPGPGAAVNCGSFVVAVLDGAGFRAPASLGRAPALRILESLAGDGEIWRWRGTVPALQRELVRRGDGIYLLGLARHVGFAVVRDDRVRLVHASRGEGRVVDEPMAESPALRRSRGAPIFAARLSARHGQAVRSWLAGAVLGPR